MQEEAKNENMTEQKTEAPPKKKKKGKNKLLKIGVVSLGVILILLIVLSVSLGMIVKGAVNHVLPTVTGTKCNMDSCYINLFTGSLSIKNFVIGNPEGYETPHAFKLGEVYVDVAVTSLLSEKIVIQNITVDNMEASFETKLTETNIGVIKDNIDKLSKKEEETEPQPDAETAESEEGSGGGKKLQIDNFKFVNSKVYMHAGVGTSIPLPEIVITGIGADSEEGASVIDVSEEVFSEIYLAILKSVKNINTEDLEKGANQALDTAKEGTDAVIKGVKDLFGGKKE